MTEKQQEIWDYLIQNAQGIGNAKKINIIAKAIDLPEYGTNNDNLRNWIKDMVINHKSQIGTCKNGAFIIRNNEELEEAARYVERNNRAGAVR